MSCSQRVPAGGVRADRGGVGPKPLPRHLHLLEAEDVDGVPIQERLKRLVVRFDVLERGIPAGDVPRHDERH
eukprot:2025499-Prymnesium_polylepis.1